MGNSFWKGSKFLSLYQKYGFLIANQIWHFEALNRNSLAQKIRFILSTDLKTNLWQTKYGEKSFEEFQHLSSFSRKMVMYSSTNIGILKP